MKTKLILAGLMCFSAAHAVPAAARAGMTIVGQLPRTLTAAQVAAADKSETAGTVSADKKTLMFRQKQVRLVIHSGPANDMLSYRIGGLRNPAVVVPAGATLKVLFINTDDDMTHNLRFTVQKMPFKGTIKSEGTGDLPHKSGAVVHTEELTLRLPTVGTYTYLCTVPGHAPGGMFGTLSVR